MSSSSAIVPAQNVKGYPSPLASQDDLVRDPNLFWDSLRSFHSALGTKYMIPVIGGKELNLHVLYVEVTKRGGYDKIVAEKKWREVGMVFEFSATTTSASYALRKHYNNYLYHFEQLYFKNLHAPAAGPMSFEAIGTIDAKIECGYLVSVKLGNETLNGVLYHPDQVAGSSTSKSVSRGCTDIVPYNPKSQRDGQSRRRRRIRRRRRGGGDPAHPKPNRSGYNFFFAEKHMKLKSLYPNREREFTKMIGESWNSLTLEEKTVYQNIGLQDKERYQREMKEYKERMQMRLQS